MRDTCLFCVSKHISQSIVLLMESVKGYSEHYWLSIGHLAEAEDESSGDFPELTNEIRRVRIALMGQEGKFEHADMMQLLRDARAIAEKVNGLSEKERILGILYPDETHISKGKVVGLPS